MRAYKTQKEAEEYPRTNVNTVVAYMTCEDVQPMARMFRMWHRKSFQAGVQKCEQKSDKRCFQGEAQRSS